MTGTFINVAPVLLGSALDCFLKTESAPGLQGYHLCPGAVCAGHRRIQHDRHPNTPLRHFMHGGRHAAGGAAEHREADGRPGELLRRKLVRGGGNSRFVEGFVTASVLSVWGAMAINGSMEAGMLGKYDILVSKSVIDGVTLHHLRRSHGRGRGVLGGAAADLRGWADADFRPGGTGMDPAVVVTEMSAVGRTIIVGIALNMLGLPKEKNPGGGTCCPPFSCPLHTYPPPGPSGN